LEVVLPLIELEYHRGASERQLRRQLDLATARATVDREYADCLLGDPVIAVAEQGCTPRQYTQLRRIQAETIQEFARQALALFWPASLDTDRTEDGEEYVAQDRASSAAS